MRRILCTALVTAAALAAAPTAAHAHADYLTVAGARYGLQGYYGSDNDLASYWPYRFVSHRIISDHRIRNTIAYGPTMYCRAVFSSRITHNAGIGTLRDRLRRVIRCVA